MSVQLWVVYDDCRCCRVRQSTRCSCRPLVSATSSSEWRRTRPTWSRAWDCSSPSTRSSSASHSSFSWTSSLRCSPTGIYVTCVCQLALNRFCRLIVDNNRQKNRRLLSGVTIGRARRAVHAGPALWGPKICPTLFLKSFFGKEGAILEYLHAGPLQPCYATALAFFEKLTVQFWRFSFPACGVSYTLTSYSKRHLKTRIF